MNALIVILLVWAVCKLIGTASRRARENAAQREMERIKAEQAAHREAERQRIAWQREQTRRMVEHDKAIAKAQKEREALRKEQERAAQERAKQAAQLAKHEEQIAKLQQTVRQCSADIEYLMGHQADLYAQLDNLLLLQAGTLPGSKDFDKYQSKIVSLKGKIHTTESRLSKAQFNHAQAKQKLSA